MGFVFSAATSSTPWNRWSYGCFAAWMDWISANAAQVDNTFRLFSTIIKIDTVSVKHILHLSEESIWPWRSNNAKQFWTILELDLFWVVDSLEQMQLRVHWTIFFFVVYGVIISSSLKALERGEGQRRRRRQGDRASLSLMEGGTKS